MFKQLSKGTQVDIHMTIRLPSKEKVPKDNSWKLSFLKEESIIPSDAIDKLEMSLKAQEIMKTQELSLLKDKIDQWQLKM